MQDLRVLAELFSAKSMREVAWYGSSEIVRASLHLLPLAESHAGSLRLLFERAFRVLRLEYPVEYVFKSGLLARLLFGRHSPRTTAFYPEFQIGDARADVLLVNGEATVYEIKTRYDSPDRLRAQLDEYYRCVSSVTLVTDEATVDGYLELLPEHVGVSTLTAGLSLSTKRRPGRNAAFLDHRVMFSVLRQKEYRKIVDALGVDLGSVDPAEEYEAGLAAFQSLPTSHAQRCVIDALRARQRTERIAALCNRLPPSLHAAAFSYRLRSSDWGRIVKALSPDETEGAPGVLPLPEG